MENTPHELISRQVKDLTVITVGIEYLHVPGASSTKSSVLLLSLFCSGETEDHREVKEFAQGPTASSSRAGPPAHIWLTQKAVFLPTTPPISHGGAPTALPHAGGPGAQQTPRQPLPPTLLSFPQGQSVKIPSTVMFLPEESAERSCPCPLVLCTRVL